MSRDPETYADPEVFNPDRFRGDNDDTKEIVDPRAYIFGFGRRYNVPPQAHLAS